VDATKSSLDRMVDSDLEQTAERIVNLANDNITVLKTDYGVLGTDVTALDTARTTFASIKTSPREAVAARKVQTASLSQLIASARSIFRNEIDKMVTKFRKTNPDFYNGYFAARVIDQSRCPRTPRPSRQLRRRPERYPRFQS